MKKIILFASIVLFALLGIFGFYYIKTQQSVTVDLPKSAKPVVIGFSIGTLQEERWQRDRDEWLKNTEKINNVSLDIQASNNNSQTQISQIEAMIAKGVNVLVVVPYDAKSLTGVIKKAHDSGIKVISYDRLILNSDVDVYLSFDNEKVGEYEAKHVVDALKSKIDSGEKVKIAYIGGSTTDNNAVLLKKGSFSVLKPLIDSGKVEIVVDKFTPDWDPQNAYKNLKTYLDKSKGDIDGVIAANDGTAGGAIKALEEHKLQGLVPVSGQDAELSACQRVIAGTQIATVYKSIPKLAVAGIDLAIKLANGEEIATNSKVNDGTNEVPALLLEPIAVTKENMEATIIKDGYHKASEVYKK